MVACRLRSGDLLDGELRLCVQSRTGFSCDDRLHLWRDMNIEKEPMHVKIRDVLSIEGDVSGVQRSVCEDVFCILVHCRLE